MTANSQIKFLGTRKLVFEIKISPSSHSWYIFYKILPMFKSIRTARHRGTHNQKLKQKQREDTKEFCTLRSK